MTHQDAAKAIRSRFKTLVEDVEEVPAVYDNGPDLRTVEEMWMRFSIDFGTTTQVELSGRFRTVGLATVQVFTPVGTGDGDAVMLADRIKAAFRCVSVDGIVWRTPSINNVGVRDVWWQVNVTCPFYFDDTE